MRGDEARPSYSTIPTEPKRGVYTLTAPGARVRMR